MVNFLSKLFFLFFFFIQNLQCSCSLSDRLLAAKKLSVKSFLLVAAGPAIPTVDSNCPPKHEGVDGLSCSEPHCFLAHFLHTVWQLYESAANARPLLWSSRRRITTRLCTIRRSVLEIKWPVGIRTPAGHGQSFAVCPQQNVWHRERREERGGLHLRVDNRKVSGKVIQICNQLMSVCVCVPRYSWASRVRA